MPRRSGFHLSSCLIQALQHSEAFGRRFADNFTTPSVSHGAGAGQPIDFHLSQDDIKASGFPSGAGFGLAAAHLEYPQAGMMHAEIHTTTQAALLWLQNPPYNTILSFLTLSLGNCGST